jgi:hypothetical protein
VKWTGFLTAEQHKVRDAFVVAIRAECPAPTADAVINLADIGIAAEEVHRVGDDYKVAALTEKDLAESLLFYRRSLTQEIICSMIAAAPHGVLDTVHQNAAAVAEDLANAICERLAARETGQADGYKDLYAWLRGISIAQHGT